MTVAFPACFNIHCFTFLGSTQSPHKYLYILKSGISTKINKKIISSNVWHAWHSCYHFMLHMTSRTLCGFSTPLKLLRKLQLWASYCNSNPCGTYIITDTCERTFQLSFQEALLPCPLSLHPGRWRDREPAEGDCHLNSCYSENRSICCVIKFYVSVSQEGVEFCVL